MAVEIIGRREELLAFDGFLGAVPAGGQALLLEGDAGIGKTALWQEGNRLALERGFRVLTSRSAHSETQIAFATVGDMFAPVVEETLPRLTPVQRRALETALLLREPDGPPPEVRLLGLALLSVVRGLSQDGQLLLGLDDVQWVDASSAEVLRFMLRRLEGEPVGVLATVRGQPVEVPLELDKAFGGFQRLAVEPLSVGAIHRLLWGRLALNLPRPELVRVHEIAGGNPFFALELGRGLVDGTVRADGTDVALPQSLVALVTERLRALPPRARETLAATAALAAAATHARGRGAAQAAAELAERAVALTPVSAVESINRRRITAAEHCRYAGDMEKAAVLLEEVVDSSQRGRIRAEALTHLAGARGMTEGFPVTMSLLSDALAEPDLEPRQEVNILCELAWMAQ